MRIEDQASEVLKSELMRDRNGKFYISKNFDFLYEGIENFDVVKQKVFALVDKLNSLEGEELEKFLDLDFQNDVYSTL